jgi:hypothetical protein
MYEANPLRGGDAKPPVSGEPLHSKCKGRLKIAGLPAVARRYERVSSTPVSVSRVFSKKCLWVVTPLAVMVGQMDYTQRCIAARLRWRLPHFLLCAAITVLVSACGGGDGTSSEGSAATDSATVVPPTASDTLSVTPPSISGTPANTVVAGSSYSFQPTASSSDGGTLSFSITNKPSWATFSTTTGQLSGTPSSSNVGTDAGIAITVTEGTSTTALAAFTITVVAAATTATPPQTEGTATLSWAAPTQNTDGSSVTDLSGYVIAYGTNPGALTQTVTVSSAAATSYTIQNLVAGTWYFAISAVESGGVSSSLSSVVSTTIQ